MKRLELVAGALLVAGLTASGLPHLSEATVIVSAAPKLADLRGVDELKTLFNRDAGKVRLVLLVSPT